MKSLMLLWQQLAQECANMCGTSTVRDFKTVSDRTKTEGFSFLTITLTNFGKDLEKALDQGFVDSSHFVGFQRRGGLPKFLSGFLCLVFDPRDGLLLPTASIDAIRSLRQLTLMFGKVEVPCTPARNQKAIDAYVQCESDVKELDRERCPDKVAALRRVFSMLYGPMFNNIEQELSSADYNRFLPRHGPGATSDGFRGNEKFLRIDWTARLDSVFPIGEFLLPNYRYMDLIEPPLEKGEGIVIREPGQEKPAKVTLVPKTLKTPRIIAEEPTCMQYAQQALLLRFLDEWYKHEHLVSFVDFRDQGPNQVLARKGSSDGSLATLDLSEASDRVSNQLIRDLFSWWPNIAEAIDATRSRKASLPSGQIIRLAKFASMGSAMCFQIEAMVFFAIIVLSLEQPSKPLSPKTLLKEFRDRVRVFGDDLIVPEDRVSTVIENLEAFGFKVNLDKSFWTGKFRESCGGDYYDGNDVNVIRVRKLIPSDHRSAEEVISFVSLRNQLYFAGYWATCQWIDNELHRILRGKFPLVSQTSPVIGRHSVSFFPIGDRMCEDLHKPLVHGYVQSTKLPSNSLDGSQALLKFFLKRGEMPLDRDHLERSGRPRSVRIKTRWSSAV